MAMRPANSPSVANEAHVDAPAVRPTPRIEFPHSLASAIDRCWRKAAAPADWNLTPEVFHAALQRSVAHRFGDSQPSDKAIETYLETLHAGDLALARTCSDGNPVAWDFFVTQFRPELYSAARAIAGDANARELADSLYADLYGLRESEGRRKSLFDYFHGRSKLSTWLRAVLAQRYVDEIRRTRKLESLEDETGEDRREVADLASASTTSPTHAVPDPERAKYLAVLQATLTGALNALEPRDRLRLAYYYADDRTLAEIGRVLGEHEATVSRKLERARRDVRKHVEAALREGKKWNEAQLRQCLDYARGDWPFDLTSALQSASSGVKQTQQPGSELNADVRKI
jgi:RNA polymerase sigma factor (sigma-70 family)